MKKALLYLLAFLAIIAASVGAVVLSSTPNSSDTNITDNAPTQGDGFSDLK